MKDLRNLVTQAAEQGFSLGGGCDGEKRKYEH